MSANPIDLCTLADVKLYLGFADTDTSADDVLQMIITAASQFASSYCSRIFQHSTYNEVFNGTGGRVQVLPNTPVTAVSAVTINNITPPLSPDPSVQGYTFDDFAVYLRGFTFCQGLQNVAVTYDAGYTTIPADLSNAIVEMVCTKFRMKSNLGTVSKGIAGETIAFGGSVGKYGFGIGDMSPSVKTILDLYQRASL